MAAKTVVKPLAFLSPTMHDINIVLQKTVMPKVTKTNERFRYVLTYNSIRSRYSLIENALVDTYFDGNVPFLSKDIKR